MTLSHARWWHRHIQPSIDRQSGVRADRGWRWPRIYATTHLVGGAFRQKPVGLIAAVIHGDRFMPVAMAVLVEAYPHLPDPKHEAVFLWYATRCPDEVIEMALEVKADAVPKRLMEITVDLAVTHSFNAKLQGRVGLHAAREGGPELAESTRVSGCCAFRGLTLCRRE